MRSPTQTNWHVITGGPGTGKTALITMLARQGYATVPEAAREIIDEGLQQGLTLHDIRGEEQQWQDKILHRILHNEAAVDPGQLTFFDRGVHDGLAHLRYYKVEPSHHWKKVSGKPYRTVFLLEPLPAVEKDYARIEDVEFTERITKIMEDIYTEWGMAPVRIPYLPPQQRLELILSKLDLPPPK